MGMASLTRLKKAGIQHSSRRKLLLTYRTDTGLAPALQASGCMGGGITVGTAENLHHPIRFSGIQHTFHLLLFFQYRSAERTAMKARGRWLFCMFGFRVYVGAKGVLAVGGTTRTPRVQHLSLDTQHQQKGNDGPRKKKNDNFDGCFSFWFV